MCFDLCATFNYNFNYDARSGTLRARVAAVLARDANLHAHGATHLAQHTQQPMRQRRVLSHGEGCKGEGERRIPSSIKRPAFQIVPEISNAGLEPTAAVAL